MATGFVCCRTKTRTREGREKGQGRTSVIHPKRAPLLCVTPTWIADWLKRKERRTRERDDMEKYVKKEDNDKDEDEDNGEEQKGRTTYLVEVQVA